MDIGTNLIMQSCSAPLEFVALCYKTLTVLELSLTNKSHSQTHMNKFLPNISNSTVVHVLSGGSEGVAMACFLKLHRCY